MTSWQITKRSPLFAKTLRAEDEVRTRDLQLGKLSLYQLSYFRESNGKSDCKCKVCVCSCKYFYFPEVVDGAVG